MPIPHPIAQPDIHCSHLDASSRSLHFLLRTLFFTLYGILDDLWRGRMKGFGRSIHISHNPIHPAPRHLCLILSIVCRMLCFTISSRIISESLRLRCSAHFSSRSCDGYMALTVSLSSLASVSPFAVLLFLGSATSQ